VNQFHKLINKSKTKDTEFDSGYQFTLRHLEKKRRHERTHQTQEAESGCWQQTLRKSTILDEMGEEKKKSGVKRRLAFCALGFFRWTSTLAD